MYYSRRKSIRISREQEMHRNRHQRHDLYADPNIITPVYPELIDDGKLDENFALWIKTQMPSLDNKLVIQLATRHRFA